MSSRRRHANDFTDSLNSFRQTSDEESSQAVSQGSSEYRLDSIRNKQGKGDKCNHSKNNESRASIILAGSLASQQCISLSNSCNTAGKNYSTTYSNREPLSTDILNVSDETSYLSIKPDLNKCINLFHNEHLNKEYDSLEEQLNTAISETTVTEDTKPCHLSKNKTIGPQDFNNRPRSMSTDSLRNIILLKEELRRSKSYTLLNRNLKRDTNYNIKIDQFFPTKITTKIGRNEKVETIIPSFTALSLTKSSTLPSRKDDTAYFTEENQTQDSTNSERSSKEELDPSELKTFLHSLADEKPVEEAAGPQRLLKRLSVNYYDSPNTFTEGLLTIIEESVINNDSCSPVQYPEVSLCRFNEELRKMCKFLEDETVPEWPQSPGMSTSICTRRKSQESKLDLLRKSLGAFATPDKSLHVTTPVSSRRNIKSPKKMCRRMLKNIAPNLLHDSTNTFESLEAYCTKLYPNEYKCSPVREKNRLQSPLQNMDSIWRTCESQMASLQDSPNIHEQIKKAGTCTSNSPTQHNKTSEAQNLHRLLPREKYDRTDSKRASDTRKQRTECSKRRETIELDDLENTIMYEIAKKRKRCLDTAKVMMEIDATLESTQETYPKIVISESLPSRNDDKLMEILMCAKKYQDYLEKNKPLLNLLHRVRLSSPRTPRDRKDARTKKLSNENLDCTLSVLSGNKATLRTPKRSPRRKSTCPSVSSTKHRSANKTIGSKSRLFVTPGKAINKSIKPKRTYFPNMLPNKQNEPSISPHAKEIYRQIGSYDHVVSPVGMYIRGTDSHLKNLRSKTDETLSVPKRKQTTQSSSPKIKFRLSPKRPKQKLTGTSVRGENVVDTFSHSKLPLRIRTTKEAENRRVRNRANELLRSTPGHIKAVQTNYLKPPEIHYSSAEES